MTGGSALRRVRWALAAVLAIGLAHVVYRATVLGVEYFDGYEYLRNARALTGDRSARYEPRRPPLVSILQIPAMAVVRASPPAAPIRLRAPHLTSALVAILSAGAVYALYARPLGTTLALFGALLFVGTRYFVHYGPHVMADVPSAGLAAATFALYLRARERRSLGAFALCGAALGAGVLCKFPLVALGPALVLSEVWLAAVTRRIDGRCWAGVAVACALGAALVPVVLAVLLVGVHGSEWFPVFARTLRDLPMMSGIGASADESWRDYGAMSVAMLSLPTMLLFAAGVLLAALRPEARDVPCLAGLAAMGGMVVLVLRHNEARYLLPAVPFILYFALRSVGAALDVARARWPAWGRPARAAAVAIAALTVSGMLGVGVHQAILDEDPLYRSDVQRRAAASLFALRRGSGRLLWSGPWHTLRTRWSGSIPHDEFIGVFHFPSIGLLHLLDRALDPPPLWPRHPGKLSLVLRDGDTVLHAMDALAADEPLPPGREPPIEVWAARRLAFRALGEGEYAGVENPDLRVRLEWGLQGAALASSSLSGTWQVLVQRASETTPRFAGVVALRPGVAVPLTLRARSEIPEIVLFQLRRFPID